MFQPGGSPGCQSVNYAGTLWPRQIGGPCRGAFAGVTGAGVLDARESGRGNLC